MEVHAHTHTERKKFTHYLLGVFNVIPCRVLWVSCRETKGTLGGSSAGKQYMKSMLFDLKADTAQIIHC